MKRPIGAGVPHIRSGPGRRHERRCGHTTLHQVDWPYALSAAGFAAAVSVLMSLGASQVGDRGTAALLPTSETPGDTGEGGEGDSIARDGNAPR